MCGLAKARGSGGNLPPPRKKTLVTICSFSAVTIKVTLD